MKEEKVQTEVTKLMADDGYVFVRIEDNAVLGATLWLGVCDSSDNYKEVPYVEPTESTSVDAQNVETVSVKMRQARLALAGAGLLDAVNAMMDSMTGEEGIVARIEWEYAATVERSSPLIAMLGGALNLSDEQIDNLFEIASKL